MTVDEEIRHAMDEAIADRTELYGQPFWPLPLRHAPTMHDIGKKVPLALSPLYKKLAGTLASLAITDLNLFNKVRAEMRTWVVLSGKLQ